MNDLKQITNYNIKNASEVEKNIVVGGQLPKRQFIYKVITTDMLGKPISKFGYCCEPVALNYPIFLTIEGEEKEFQIGKTGMLESQPEEWRDVNSEDEELLETQEASVYISEIKVPWREKNKEDSADYFGYKFTIDYALIDIDDESITPTPEPTPETSPYYENAIAEVEEDKDTLDINKLDYPGSTSIIITTQTYPYDNCYNAIVQGETLVAFSQPTIAAVPVP